MLHEQVIPLISKIKQVPDSGCYNIADKSVEWRFATLNEILAGLDERWVLAHEYGHAIDFLIEFSKLHYTEIDILSECIDIEMGGVPLFQRTVSMSDEFLSALRQDRERLQNLKAIKKSLLINPTTVAVQDAIVGLFGDKNWIKNAHYGYYFERRYDLIRAYGKQAELKTVLDSLGYNTTTLQRIKKHCKIYTAALETWANICGAVICDDVQVKYIKEYLPNCYRVFWEIVNN